MSDVLKKESRISIAGKKAFKLISIEVNKIRDIPDASSYKDRVIDALTTLYDFYQIKDHVSDIHSIYEMIESKKEQEAQFKQSIGIIEDKNVNVFRVDESFKIFEELSLFFNEIYYVCQSFVNEDYPMYSLEDKFSDLLDDWAKEASIPYRYAVDIIQKKMNFDLEHDRRIYEIKNLTNNAWFQKNRDHFDSEDWYFSERRSRKDFIKEQTKKEPEPIKPNPRRDTMAQFMKERMAIYNTPEAKKASHLEHKWHLTEALVAEHALYDREKRTFSSLNHVGFNRLISKTYVHGRERNHYQLIENDISMIATNDQVLQLLTFFPQLSVQGYFIETEEKFKKAGSPNKFKDRDGNISLENMMVGDIVYSNLSIHVADGTKWDTIDSKDFEKIVSILGLSDACSEQDGKPVLTL